MSKNPVNVVQLRNGSWQSVQASNQVAVDFVKRNYLLFQLMDWRKTKSDGFHPSRGFHGPDYEVSKLVMDQ